jgi:ADP-ribose pyrophosphatase YjhB (NUDIX family)
MKMNNDCLKAKPPAQDATWAKFCPRCAGTLEDRYIEMEQHVRKICGSCGFILYLNPKVVAAAIPRQENQIWLLQRKIEPSWGKWTFPGGYVDLGESVAEAAIRETYEETLLDIRLDGLLNVYSYRDAGIVLVVYHATVTGGEAGVTLESQAVKAFAFEDIPWDELAFPSTREALKEYINRDSSLD